VVSAGLIASFVVVILAAAVSGLIGFGLALVAVPLLLIFFEPAEVVVLLSFISLFTNIVIVQDSWRQVETRSILSLMPWAIIGLILGTEILRSVNPDYIRLGVGVVVVLSAMLLLRDVTIKGIEGRLGTVFAGATSGALATSTGIAGPPIVLLFAARRLPKASFRVSNAAYFLVLGVAIIITLFARSIVEVSEVWTAAILVPAAFIGKTLGTVLVKYLSDDAFRKITLLVVLLTGVLGVLTAVRALL
jgi:uncharacterized membrane protein YfcA